MISGRTRLIAHLGVPTEGFRAPLIYNPYFEAEGIDCVVVPMGCEEGDLAALLPALFRLRNIAGALITMPHKVSVTGLLDRLSPEARLCGAANAVRREPDGSLTGDMFDGAGFVAGMRRKGREIAGGSALVIGAGGVGSAIAAALVGSGAARLRLHDTDRAAVDRLASRLRDAQPAVAIETGTGPEHMDIVVNATPLGMGPDDPMPLDPAGLGPDTFVGDVVLRSGPTPLLAAAATRGCATMTGIDMLFEQIPAYLDFFGLPVTTPERLRALARM